MEVKLDAGEKCKLNYATCPCCGGTFNMKDRKKTEHHAIPKFMKPITDVTVTLCKKCHELLNSNYTSQEKGNAIKTVGKSQPKSFEDFLDNYKLMKKDFLAKKIDRGKFGEGLWLNLVNYLEFADQNFVKKK